MPTAAEIDRLDSSDNAVAILREDAAGYVAESLVRHQPQARSVDASEQFDTREDVRHHINFLAAALATGMPEAFADYVRWAASVMDSRGASLQTLDVSLERLGAFFAGHLPREHRDAVAKVIDEGRKALAAAPCAGAPAYYGVPHPQAMAQVPDLVRCLLAGDVAASRALAFRAWESEGDYVRVATRLFQPALYETGLLWQRNRATVAQEHLASAICQTLLTQLFLTAALFVKPNGRSAVFAAVEGDGHALGLRIVADAFELAGWSVQHLGADTPTASLVAHVGAVRPDVVGVSASLAQHLPTLRRVVERLRADLGQQCPTILVGGLPLNQMENAWRWIGADAWSPNAESAVAAVD